MSPKIFLSHPDGFLEARSFFGYEQPSTGATITATTLSCAIEEVASGFSDEVLMRQGMTVLARHESSEPSQPRLLLLVMQPLGTTIYQKWIALSGDTTLSLIATATFRQEYGELLSELLRDAVVSSFCERDDSEPALQSGFPQLQYAGTLGNNVLFTESGILPASGIDEPLFVAGYAVAEFQLPPSKQFAEHRIGEIPETQAQQIEETVHVCIAGRNGFETIATAKDLETNRAVLLYQVVLFEQRRYFLMQGIVALSRRDQLLPVFQALSRRFTPQPQRTATPSDDLVANRKMFFIEG